jgi:hypothetical protein
VTSLSRCSLSSFAVLPLATLFIACGNKSAGAPNPTGYDWPDSLAYRIEYAAEAGRDTEAVERHDMSMALRLAVRDDRFLVWNDSVSRLSIIGGSLPTREQLWPEDTLHYYVRLGRLGEISGLEPGCDPALPACKEALASALPLELRRIIPRLPIWWPPKGYTWEDTLAFDDLPRRRGSRGSVVSYYRASRDTVLQGHGYWIVTWSSVRRAFRKAANGGIIAEPQIEEHGAVYVDKQLLLPGYAEWFGTVVPPPGLRASGVTGKGLRGRAILVGSPFDSVRRAR